MCAAHGQLSSCWVKGKWSPQQPATAIRPSQRDPKKVQRACIVSDTQSFQPSWPDAFTPTCNRSWASQAHFHPDHLQSAVQHHLTQTEAKTLKLIFNWLWFVGSDVAPKNHHNLQRMRSKALPAFRMSIFRRRPAGETTKKSQQERPCKQPSGRTSELHWSRNFLKGETMAQHVHNTCTDTTCHQ